MYIPFSVTRVFQDGSRPQSASSLAVWELVGRVLGDDTWHLADRLVFRADFVDNIEEIIGTIFTWTSFSGPAN